MQAILDVQHRWVEALVRGDTAALDAILIDSYVDTDESGSRFDKGGVLAALKSGDLHLTSITLLQTDVHRVWQRRSIDRHFCTDRSVSGSTNRTKDTFHRHAGFAEREVESGRGTSNRRARRLNWWSSLSAFCMQDSPMRLRIGVGGPPTSGPSRSGENRPQ